MYNKGRLPLPKRMNFRKSSKRPFPPPPAHFRKVMLQFFLKFMTEVSSIMAKICNINFWIENDPPPLLNFSENSSVLEGECVPNPNRGRVPKKCSKKCGLLKKGAISLSEKKLKGRFGKRPLFLLHLLAPFP